MEGIVTTRVKRARMTTYRYLFHFPFSLVRGRLVFRSLGREEIGAKFGDIEDIQACSKCVCVCGENMDRKAGIVLGA